MKQRAPAVHAHVAAARAPEPENDAARAIRAARALESDTRSVHEAGQDEQRRQRKGVMLSSDQAWSSLGRKVGQTGATVRA